MSFRTGLVGEASRTDGRCGAGSALALYRCVFSVKFRLMLVVSISVVA